MQKKTENEPKEIKKNKRFLSTAFIKPIFRTALMYNGKSHVVTNTMHRIPGRRLGFVHTTIRNLETNSSTAVKFKSTDNVDFCNTTTKNLDFPYVEGAQYHFLDSQSYDDIVIPTSAIGEDAKWLLENGMVLQVPIFIKQGDVIKVRTEDETYVSRA